MCLKIQKIVCISNVVLGLWQRRGDIERGEELVRMEILCYLR